jgi:hypothetical protein
MEDHGQQNGQQHNREDLARVANMLKMLGAMPSDVAGKGGRRPRPGQVMFRGAADTSQGSVMDQYNQSRTVHVQTAYPFGSTHHPVFLHLQDIQPLAGSPVNMHVQQTKHLDTFTRYVNRGQPDQIFSTAQERQHMTGELDGGALEKVDGIKYVSYMVLPVPACYLKKNYTSLFDFDTSTPESQSYAQMVSFVCAAMSDQDVGITDDHKRGGAPVHLFRNPDNKLLPRMRSFVEAVFKDMPPSSANPFHADPTTDEARKRFRAPEKYRWANEDLLEGYR